MEDKKLCRHCKSEIPKKAKTCPVCRKSQTNAFVKIIAIVLIIFGCLIACSAVLSEGVSEVEKENKKEKENFSYKISKEYTDEIGSHYIEGAVKNNNNKNYSYVQIEFVCYDKKGNNLGTAVDNTNNLGANETWKFKAMLLSTNGDVANCKFKEITNW